MQHTSLLDKLSKAGKYVLEHIQNMTYFEINRDILFSFFFPSITLAHYVVVCMRTSLFLFLFFFSFFFYITTSLRACVCGDTFFYTLSITSQPSQT